MCALRAQHCSIIAAVRGRGYVIAPCAGALRLTSGGSKMVQAWLTRTCSSLTTKCATAAMLQVGRGVDTPAADSKTEQAWERGVDDIRSVSE